MMRGFGLLLAGVILALCMAAVGESQGTCPGGVCPVQPQQQWRGTQQQPRQFVCRIYNQLGREQSIGSGTLVSKGQGYGVVLTCAHLFDEGTGKISLRFPGGNRYTGAVIAKNRKHDLAFLKVTPRPTEPLAVLARDYAKQGERITHAGYGRDGRYLEVAGTVIGYRKWRGNDKAEILDVTGGSRQGDSGGPILNAQGEVIGVLATTDDKTTQGTFNGRVCAFAMENRYLFPWNADLAEKKDNNKLEASRPIQQPPLPRQQAPPVDLSEVKQRLGNLESQQAEQLKLIDDTAKRIAPLEATADKARQLAEQWPELQAAMADLERVTTTATGQATQAAESARVAVDSVTAVAGKATEAVESAAETKAEVDAALDEDAPDGLMARIRSRVHDRVAESMTAKLAARAGMPVGQMAGILGIGFGIVIWLVRKDILDKAKTGDPLFIEKIAARTRNEVDDKIAAKIGSRAEQWGSPDHGLREELADIRGMLAKVTSKSK